MPKTKNSLLTHRARMMRKANSAEEMRSLLNETFYMVGDNMFDHFEEAMKEVKRTGKSVSDIQIKVPLGTIKEVDPEEEAKVNPP